MRILVTGGAGFIGSNFVRRSLEGVYPATRDAELTVLDNLSYAGDLANLDGHRNSPRIRFVKGDIRDRATVREAVGGASAVVHFAAESHVDRSIAAAGAFVETNVTGTHTLLDSALEAGVGQFVLVSTDEVYGSIDSGEWTERSPLEPNSPYSASKAAAEHLARAYFHTHGLHVCVVRAANNYGPYQHPEKLIPLFATNFLSGHTVPLYGTGTNVREWLHVDDHCRGIALVLESGRAGEVYNIGSGRRLPNRQVAEMLARLTNAGTESIRSVPDRKGHDRRYALDSKKITRELGFRPRVPLEQGIADVVRWYADNREWWQPRRGGIATSPTNQSGASWQ